MLILLSFLLLFVSSDQALQCINNCSINNIPFHQSLIIPDGRCQQRISALWCSIDLEFRYDRQTYYANFDRSSISRDFIYITSGPYLSYSVQYSCSKDTNCPLSYAQNRINEMVGRSYDATRIYGQLAPLIENPSRNGSIQCYNMKNEIVYCSSNQLCVLEYDTQGKKVRSRECRWESVVRVSVFDSQSYTTFDIQCTRNLCNDDATFEQIKTIFANNGLTDANGRRIAAGAKQMISILLITFALIFIIFSYF